MLQKYYNFIIDKFCNHRFHRRFTAVIVLLAAIVSGTILAQNNPSPKAPQKDTEILFLGTAGGPPLRYGRSEPSTLLMVDGRQYLIDCGIGTMQRMVQADIHSETIKTIFITHHHPDHDLGLADVMANDFFQLKMTSSVDTISIYGPPQTKEFVDAAFHYISIPFNVFAAEPIGITDSILQNPFKVHDIQPGKVFYQDDKVRVIAIENSHYALTPEQFHSKMKSYSYRFETSYGVIVFTGDTGPSDAVIKLAKGADVLVSEVHDIKERTKFVDTMAEKNHWSHERSNGFMEHMKLEHLDLKEVGELASKAQVKSVLLYHFSPKNPEAFVMEVKKYFSGHVFATSDLNWYCLKKQTTEGIKGTSVLSLCQKHPIAN